MKNIIFKLFLLALTTSMVWSCDKAGDVVVLSPGTSPVLTADKTAVVLNENAKDDNAVTFNWTASDFGYAAAVKYTLQIATKGSNFACPQSVVINARITKSFTN